MTTIILSFCTTLLTLVADVVSAADKPASRTWTVNQKHPKADDKGPGTVRRPFKSISPAALAARPGDTVLVYGGTYRERVAPANGGEPGKPVVYLAAPGEAVYVKGSEVWQPAWQPVAGRPGVYTGKLDATIFGTYNPFRTPAKRLSGRRTLGQVFVDGRPLAEAGQAGDLYLSPGTWMASASGDSLQVHFPASPKTLPERLIEITVRDRLFAPHRRGLGYITVKGFIFEHCANQFPSGFWKKRGEDGAPQAGALGTRSGNHWVIENNTIRYAKSIGLDCGTEGGYDLEGEQPDPDTVGYHMIRNNTISDNGACGIAGYKHTGTQIVANLIERNNHLGWTAPETGGIKVHGFINGRIEGNILRDNDCFGIWLDNVYYHSRVSRNVITGSTGAGIFVEMGEGPVLLDHNVIAFTRNGEGIYTHDASGVTVAHNLLYSNSHFGVYMRIVTERKVRNHKGERVTVSTKNQRILNNIFIDNYRGHISLPLDGGRVGNNLSDYNLFINGTQWHWEGLGLNRFVVNTNDGRVSKDTLALALVKALDKLNVPSAQRPNLKLWREQPYLTFDWWQALTGNDRHSLVPAPDKGRIENGAIEKGSMSFSPLEMYVQFTSDAPFRQLKCPPVAGVETDFYGLPLPATDALPGPFQQLNRGHNRKLLIPAPK